MSPSIATFVDIHRRAIPSVIEVMDRAFACAN